MKGVRAGLKWPCPRYRFVSPLRVVINIDGKIGVNGLYPAWAYNGSHLLYWAALTTWH